jgi:ureidoacrylate peracid hydrolase
MHVDVIDPKKTAMIVVDMQNDFVASGAAMETPAARRIVPQIAEALRVCRDVGIKIIYTAHVHRRDGCDMGLFDDLHPPIANRDALVDGTPGVEIYADLAPAAGEHVIKKHRYSGFFGTDLDIILREWGVDTVIISGTTSENCCHATARDAMFRNYRVVFLSDATATYDYPDRGFGSMLAAEVHHATIVVLAASTAHVMSVDDMKTRISSHSATLAGAATNRQIRFALACQLCQSGRIGDRTSTFQTSLFPDGRPTFHNRAPSSRSRLDANTIIDG